MRTPGKLAKDTKLIFKQLKLNSIKKAVRNILFRAAFLVYIPY